MNDIFKDWWKEILQEQEWIQKDARVPLLDLDKYVDRCQLSPLLPMELNIAPFSLTEIGPPAFKDLTEEIVLGLRLNLHDQKDLDIIAVWAEKLMRFCEIRYRTLKKRAIKKCGDLPAARLHLLHLTVFFLDYCLYTKDLRFFNVVLKLLDLPWLVRQKEISTLLKKGSESTVCAVFQFRVLLIREYVVESLYRGEVL